MLLVVVEHVSSNGGLGYVWLHASAPLLSFVLVVTIRYAQFSVEDRLFLAYKIADCCTCSASIKCSE